MKTYNFYGWEQATVSAITNKYKGIHTPQDLYDRLSDIWCADTCAPRLRDGWTPENKTLGQCSITAFLVQDIFGGKVYGILRPGGNYHCYNDIDGHIFDLTSEQFGDEVLSYENNPEQFREIHFAKEEKYQRYEYLKQQLERSLDDSCETKYAKGTKIPQKGTRTMIGLIVARSKNNVIGKNGQIPWRIKGEQKQFKELTTGNTVVMGRKSYEEIGHPLPNRMNIVVSNTANYSGENLLTVHSLQEALDSVKEKLDTKYGVMILQPAYTRYHLELGEISSYPPGYKENAGIFCHNNPWVSIAETVIGRGDRAFEIYKKTCPAYIEDISEVHRTEPYVYSQMVAGADAKFFGEAKNSWLTGTAAWTFVNVSQYILGVYPTHKGLSINPCVPKGFGDFELTRQFREGSYNIKVVNPDNVEKGVKSITVDGKPVEGCVIPYVKGKETYDVVVTMG